MIPNGVCISLIARRVPRAAWPVGILLALMLSGAPAATAVADPGLPDASGLVGASSSEYAPAPRHDPDPATFAREIARVNTSGIDWTTVPMTPNTAVQRGGLAPALVTLGKEIIAGKSVVLPADVGTQPGQTVSGMQGKTIWYGYLQAQYIWPGGNKIVLCWLDLYDSTPSPTLGIRHGFAISCSEPWVVAYTGDPSFQGGIMSGLGQVTNASGGVQTPYGLSWATPSDVNYSPWYAYKPYAAETGFTRSGDLQTEDQYGYIYLAVANNNGWFDGMAGTGHAGYPDCQISGAVIWCQIISNPFSFIPNDNYNCLTGQVCAEASIGTQDAGAFAGQAQQAPLAPVGDTDTEGTYDGDPTETASNVTQGHHAIVSNRYVLPFHHRSPGSVVGQAAQALREVCTTSLFAAATGGQRAEADYLLRCTGPAEFCNFTNITFRWYNKLAGTFVVQHDKRAAMDTLQVFKHDSTTLGVAGNRVVEVDVDVTCFTAGYVADAHFHDSTRDDLLGGTV